MYDFLKKRQVMGILNVTPDSFSDGGKYDSVELAVEHAQQLIAQGADIIDIGGQSTRPGYVEVPANVELVRVLPVVTALKKITDVPLSVDTFFPEVATACMQAGADIINDIAGLDRPGMVEAIAKFPDVGVIIMFSRKRSAQGLAEQLHNFYAEKINLLNAHQVDLKRICLDPGVGFHKSIIENLDLIQTPEKLRYENFPLLYGVSRKRTIGTMTGETDAAKRDPGSIAASLWLLEHGVEIVRVHDVDSMQQANRVFQTLHH